METFVDATTGASVSQISIAVGETKILGLKKFNLANLPGAAVVVSTGTAEIAACVPVVHLSDTSKKSYQDKFLPELLSQLVPVERDGMVFYQICGMAAGQANLVARQSIPPFAPYADTVPISVTPNPKRLTLPAAKHKSPPSFNTLWQNHPLQFANGSVSYPCSGGRGSLGHMQCMVRLCSAFEKSGVSFSGCFGSKCEESKKSKRKELHVHHFSDPYDFESWPFAKGACYVWKASKLAPEPMPGLAALPFVTGKQGVILFKNYFHRSVDKTSLTGGHIDLWNKNTMGNTLNMSIPIEGQSAFLRAEKICFWPIT